METFFLTGPKRRRISIRNITIGRKQGNFLQTSTAVGRMSTILRLLLRKTNQETAHIPQSTPGAVLLDTQLSTLPSDQLGLLSGQILPKSVIHQISLLHVSLEEWYNVFQLHGISTFPTPPTRFLQDAATHTRTLLNTGSLSSHNEILSWKTHTTAALELSKHLHNRFEDILQCLDDDVCQKTVTKEQKKLYGVQIALAGKIEVISTLVAAWHSTPSPALSSMVAEVMLCFYNVTM